MYHHSFIQAGEFNMSAKVTMQDIADALGFSRNTVSKAIDGV